MNFSTPPHLSDFNEIDFFGFFALPNSARFCGLKIIFYVKNLIRKSNYICNVNAQLLSADCINNF